MKWILIILFFSSVADAQTRNITVKFNAGFGSRIDSIDIGPETYYSGSVIKIPASGVVDITAWVTSDNNGPKDTYLQLVFKHGATEKIIFRKQSRKLKPRSTAGTFRKVPLASLEQIILSEE